MVIVYKLRISTLSSYQPLPSSSLQLVSSALRLGKIYQELLFVFFHHPSSRTQNLRDSASLMIHVSSPFDSIFFYSVPLGMMGAGSLSDAMYGMARSFNFHKITLFSFFVD